ncbi:TPA: hypothetical protein ACNEJR_003728 [Escherichia coli]
MNVFDFMANSPVLTFLLACLFFGLLRALLRFCTVLVNGYPPMWCDSEGRFKTDKDNDD